MNGRIESEGINSKAAEKQHGCMFLPCHVRASE